MKRIVAEIKLWWHLLLNFHQREAETLTWKFPDGHKQTVGFQLRCHQCKTKYYTWGQPPSKPPEAP